MFPKDSGTLHADVYYTWIAPAVALNLLHELRGRVRHAATFVTIVFSAKLLHCHLRQPCPFVGGHPFSDARDARDARAL